MGGQVPHTHTHTLANTLVSTTLPLPLPLSLSTTNMAQLTLTAAAAASLYYVYIYPAITWHYQHKLVILVPYLNRLMQIAPQLHSWRRVDSVINWQINLQPPSLYRSRSCRC